MHLCPLTNSRVIAVTFMQFPIYSPITDLSSAGSLFLAQYNQKGRCGIMGPSQVCSAVGNVEYHGGYARQHEFFQTFWASL